MSQKRAGKELKAGKEPEKKSWKRPGKDLEKSRERAGKEPENSWKRVGKEPELRESLAVNVTWGKAGDSEQEGLVSK